MSNTPASAMAAPNSSGCWVRQAPTSRPPLEPPLIAMRAAVDQPEPASQRAQAQKSSKVFCLAARLPAWCQVLPYSPPPRRQATASIPPRSSQTVQVGENDGVVLTATPP